MRPASRSTPIRCLALAIALAAATAQLHAQDAQRSEVTEAAQRLQGRVVEWRRDIHQHPELGNREFRTAELVADHLRSLGLEPQTGIAHTGAGAADECESGPGPGSEPGSEPLSRRERGGGEG